MFVFEVLGGVMGGVVIVMLGVTVAAGIAYLFIDPLHGPFM